LRLCSSWTARFCGAERDSEVAQERISFVIEEDIGRLHGAVNHALAMSSHQGAADLARQLHRAGDRHRAFVKPEFEGAAREQLHDQVRRVGVAPVVDQGHDVRVLNHQPRGEPPQPASSGVAFKPRCERRVSEDRRRVDRCSAD